MSNNKNKQTLHEPLKYLPAAMDVTSGIVDPVLLLLQCCVLFSDKPLEGFCEVGPFFRMAAVRVRNGKGAHGGQFGANQATHRLFSLHSKITMYFSLIRYSENNRRTGRKTLGVREHRIASSISSATSRTTSWPTKHSTRYKDMSLEMDCRMVGSGSPVACVDSGEMPWTSWEGMSCVSDGSLTYGVFLLLKTSPVRAERHYTQTSKFDDRCVLPLSRHRRRTPEGGHCRSPEGYFQIPIPYIASGFFLLLGVGAFNSRHHHTAC
jgi:hypothetical protein